MSVCAADYMKLFREAFAGIQDKLVEEIEVEGGLWVKLRARNILPCRLISICQKQVCFSSVIITARRYASAVYLLSSRVRLSVRRRYCIKTAKRRFTQKRHTIARGL